MIYTSARRQLSCSMLVECVLTVNVVVVVVEVMEDCAAGTTEDDEVGSSDTGDSISF